MTYGRNSGVSQFILQGSLVSSYPVGFALFFSSKDRMCFYFIGFLALKTRA